MISNQITFKLENKLSELDSLYRQVEAFAKKQALSPKDILEIHLCMEEHFTNIITHGYADSEMHWIEVTLSVEDEKFVVPYMTAPEIQIRDYTNDPEFNNMKQMSGAVFGLVGPDKDYTNKAGEWNHFLITIDYNKNLGQVALNGHEIVSYPLRGEAWDAMVQDSKFKDWEGFGIYSEGHIGLQDHGHDVWFRNLKIKELNE